MPPRPHQAEGHPNGNREGLPPRLARGPYFDAPHVPFGLTQGHNHPRGIEKGSLLLLGHCIMGKQDTAFWGPPSLSQAMGNLGQWQICLAPNSKQNKKKRGKICGYIKLYNLAAIPLVLTHSLGWGDLGKASFLVDLTGDLCAVCFPLTLTPERKRKYVLARAVTSRPLSTHNCPPFHPILRTMHRGGEDRPIADAAAAQRRLIKHRIFHTSIFVGNIHIEIGGSLEMCLNSVIGVPSSSLQVTLNRVQYFS